MKMDNFALFCSSFYPLLLRIVPDIQQVLEAIYRKCGEGLYVLVT